jgi:hypothetical protein
MLLNFVIFTFGAVTNFLESGWLPPLICKKDNSLDILPRKTAKFECELQLWQKSTNVLKFSILAHHLNFQYCSAKNTYLYRTIITFNDNQLNYLVSALLPSRNAPAALDGAA